ncbi:hypothetical protein E2C01_015148 [Portunus trituberculatus]|uniref:Uncharacterized protein n=1 Tax=Portunus trituberculatus TaxID=210409 RepID=A0A5B7DKW8_PORTR|nr:hypothetical protein [Portunus trituberculatus]
MCSSSLPGRPFTAQKFENGRWVDNSIAASPGGLICKDFLPQPDPDQSTCCTTTYQSFRWVFLYLPPT